MSDPDEKPVLSRYFGDASDQSVSINLNASFRDTDVSSLFDEQINLPISLEPTIQAPFSSAPSNRPLPSPARFFDNISPDSPSETLEQSIFSNFNIPLENLSLSDSRPNIAEADRRRDAWIPSKETWFVSFENILNMVSSSGSHSIEKNILTMPGIALESDMQDELYNIVAHHLGEAEAAQRGQWGCEHVTQDEQGLKELIQDGYFRAAINLTSRLLSTYGQGIKRIGFPSKHSPRSLQLWFTRFALLIKLQTYSVCEREAEAFGDLQNPDMFFQFYRDIYPNRSGSMASFSFRLLLAELPMHLNKPQVAMVKLYKMLSVVKQMIKNLKSLKCEEGSDKEISAQDRQESVKLWSGREARIQFSIVNCALQMKDYSIAMQIVEGMVANPAWGKSHIRALNSALGRICLQAGHILGAEDYFKKAANLRVSLGLDEDIRELVDKSLLGVAQNTFDEAIKYLKRAIDIEPGNIMVLNNLAVCTLYSGRLKDAIAIMEKAVSSFPNRALNESFLLNLCTLYELESSNTMGKKLELLQQLSKYKRDTFTDVTACLKLNM